jgi:hypothetical protein
MAACGRTTSSDARAREVILQAALQDAERTHQD